jgi:lipoprotein-anchoring transpeptidase ErfK/SrfK
MTKQNILRSQVVGMASLVAALLTLPTTSVSAEGFQFDWGGEKVVEGSGRATVKLAAAKKVGDIIVSFGDRKLYLVTAVGQALSYPIAVPKEKARWEGKISVTSKRENPSWTPTPTMRVENPKLPMWVPGGHPMNPLGQRALYLGSSTYRIHGTDAPWTIGSAASAGCVRMYNKDVADLYPRVNVGTSVLVTWDKYEATTDDSVTVPVVAAPVVAAKAKRAAATSQIATGSIDPAASPVSSKKRPLKRSERGQSTANAGSAATANAPAAKLPLVKPAKPAKYAVEEMSL